MELSLTAEALDAAMTTLKPFVHKPGSESPITMTAALITADKKAGTVTFVGNNMSQKLRFTITADVEESGESLVPVLDVVTALGAVSASDKSEKIRISLNDTSLGLHSKRASANVPVLDIVEAEIKPKSPKEHKGKAVDITVDAEKFPTLYNRSVPASVQSRLPNIMMWVEGDHLCFMSASPIGTTFASVGGAKSSSSDDSLTLWEPSNLKRIVGLTANADTVRIVRDDVDSPEFTIYIESEGNALVVEQVAEIVQDTYVKTRSVMMRKVGDMKSDIASTVTMKAGDIIRPMESAEKMRTIGRDRSSEDTVKVDIEADLLRLALPDGNFEEEIESAKISGDVDNSIKLYVPMALPVLNSLGPDAKVTLEFPPLDGPGSNVTLFAVVTCQDSDDSKKVGNLPATGYWSAISFRNDNH